MPRVAWVVEGTRPPLLHGPWAGSQEEGGRKGKPSLAPHPHSQWAIGKVEHSLAPLPVCLGKCLPGSAQDDLSVCPIPQGPTVLSVIPLLGPFEYAHTVFCLWARDTRRPQHNTFSLPQDGASLKLNAAWGSHAPFTSTPHSALRELDGGLLGLWSSEKEGTCHSSRARRVSAEALKLACNKRNITEPLA